MLMKFPIQCFIFSAFYVESGRMNYLVTKNNFPDNSKTHLLRIETHPSIPTRAKTNVADLLLCPDDVTSLAQKKITHIESCNLSYPPICKFVPEHNKHSYLLASKLKAISTD